MKTINKQTRKHDQNKAYNPTITRINSKEYRYLIQPENNYQNNDTTKQISTKYKTNNQNLQTINKQTRKYDQNKAYNPMIKIINSKEIRYLI